MAKGLFWKENIPKNSTLHAKISSANGTDKCNAELFLRDNSGTMVANLKDAALRAGGKVSLKGTDPTHYLGQVLLLFAGPSKVRVELRIEKPDGTLHGKKYDEVHSKTPADAVTLALFMA